jgi:hypothetical protein
MHQGKCFSAIERVSQLNFCFLVSGVYVRASNFNSVSLYTIVNLGPLQNSKERIGGKQKSDISRTFALPEG